MAEQRPNIVFVHVDQMHHKAVSAYGNAHVHTPNLDRVAADGLSLMQMHCAMPQCCPSRASWYTGRMSKEHGVVVNSCPIRPELPDLGQWLRRHGGYDTVYTGKWHVSGRNVADSFEVLIPAGQGEVNDAAVARSAVAFLANRAADSKPFFLNVGFMNPHDCCYTAGASGGVGKFRLSDDIESELPPLPENFRNDPRYAGRTGGWGKQGWRYYIYSYYRLVEMVDTYIGRVYDAVQRSPFRDNTLFIFTADHGDGLGFHGKVSKGYMEDEAWRVPAMVVYPGRIRSGQRDEKHLAIGVDIAATICDYAEVPPLPKMTVARSWRPLLEGRETTWRDCVIGETSVGGASVGVRERSCKSIFYRDGHTKVFDMAADPLEMEDLADTPRGREIAARHRQALREFIGSIELCPEPTWGRLKPRFKSLYQEYVSWYGELAAEG